MERFFLSRRSVSQDGNNGVSGFSFDDVIAFAIVMAVVLLARGTALVALNWMGDDYSLIQDPGGRGVIAANIAMLRSSGSFATWLAQWLGAVHPTLGSFWTVLTAASMAVFGLALCRFWSPGSAPLVAVITALLFALFPGQSNLFAYHMMHPAMIINYGLASFALLSYRRGGIWTLMSTAAIAFALGYQTMLSLFLVAGLLLPLFEFVSSCRDSLTVPQALMRSMKSLAQYMLVLLSGILIYFLLGKLLLLLTATSQSGRTVLAGPSLWPQKLNLLAAHLRRMLAGRGEASLPAQIKAVQCLLLANACLAWLLAVQPRARSFRLPWLQILLLAVLLLLAACAIPVPALLVVNTQENPRNLMATSVFWSGIFCLACTAGPILFRRTALILGSVIVLAYAIITNTISVDYGRLIQRQHLLASRIVERLSLQPGFAGLRTVVVVGTSADLSRDLRSVDQVWPSLDSYIGAAVLREVSGTPLQTPAAADEQRAREFSRGMRSWPEPGSTAISDDLGIVVLQRKP